MQSFLTLLGLSDTLGQLAWALITVPVLIGAYAYVGYPALIWCLSRFRRPWVLPAEPTSWPMITMTLPVYNEERVLRDRIENLLALDYPVDRRQILVLSDASTDSTDTIAKSFEDRGVQLHRLPKRAGKSAAENAALPLTRGEIIVNVDATTKIYPQSLKALVRAFADPLVGVASGRDVSLQAADADANGGESGYVGYEMSVRRLETRWFGIVGASGCFYGIRKSIYDGNFPLPLSRDFASAIMAQEHQLRAVSVEEAICGVPRVPSLKVEYRRKQRTMHRGLMTLWYKRHLMNPLVHGRFAFMLLSHKLARWLVYPSLVLSVSGMFLLPLRAPAMVLVLAIAAGFVAAGWYAMRQPPERALPRVLSLLGFLVASNIAGLRAWWQLLDRGDQDAVWEPTRRTA